MFSIKGIYKNSKVHLLEPLNIKNRTNIVITFLDNQSSPDEEPSLEEGPDFMDNDVTFEDEDDDASFGDEEDEISFSDVLDSEPAVVEQPSADDEFSEEYYTKIRRHKRYLANGNISLVENDKETTYPLFDYSAGGLSFISDVCFEVGKSLMASIKDPIEQDMSVLDFEFEVARVVEDNDKFKIGCKFFDEVDEEIWHSLMS